jgi:hypothetical protein
MKKLSTVFTILALVLSHVMCAHVAFNYRSMICCIEHTGCSAPADIALLLAIPYLIGIAVCVLLAVVFWRKSK